MLNIKYYLYYIAGKLRRIYFMQLPLNKKDLKKSRSFFIVDGATAMTILNLVGGAFLAAILRNIGVSDSANGTITAIVSLGSITQILGVNLSRKMHKIKLFVCSFAFIHRLMYAFIYFIPFLNIDSNIKPILFVVIFITANLLGNIINPSASNWLGSLVPYYVRGKYFARRDLISVASIIFVTIGYSRLLDYFKNNGNEVIGFNYGGILVLILSVINFVALSKIKEPAESYLNNNNFEMHGSIAKKHKKETKTANERFLSTIKDTFKNKDFKVILLISSTWFVAYYFSLSYFGIYQIKELGLSYTYILSVSFAANILRIICTPYIGKYADKKSWGKALLSSLFAFGISFLIFAFANPKNGKIIFLLFSMISAVASPGINLGILNLIFELKGSNDKTPFIGINSAISGTLGFLSACIGGFILDIIINNSNNVLGYNIYGQQILSFISFLLLMVLIFSVKRRIIKP